MAATFDDESLRKLILTGVGDRVEEGMLQLVEENLRQVKEGFDSARDTPEGLESIQSFLNLQRLQEGLRRGEDRPVLDRALLDRVDFLIPFFPIEEPELLHRILEQILTHHGWLNCPGDIRDRIVEEAGRQQESVRPLNRLVKKYLRANRYLSEEETTDAND